VVFAPSFIQDATVSKFADNAFYAAAGAELMGEDDEVDTHVKKERYNGVKGVVAKLIVSHQDTQKEEKTKLKYCNGEIETKDDEKATTTDNLAAVEADIDKKTAEVATLVDEIATLETTITTIASSLASAATIRKDEKALFTAGTKDRALARKVLGQAQTVLQDFYNKAALAQTSDDADPPKKLAIGEGRKKTASFGAVSMIQDISDDIAREQKDAAIAEKDAVSTFAKLQADSRTNTDARRQDVTDRTIGKAKLGIQINSLKETQTQKKDDLTALTEQLDALHLSCDELVKNYDKREKGRAFEVSQLRDVQDILAGSSIAARTGLMQDDNDDA